MRLWFALHWGEGAPLAELFRCVKSPPGCVGGVRVGCRQLVEADALVLWTPAEDFLLWDAREALVHNKLPLLAGKYAVPCDVHSVGRRWRWQDLVPEAHWLTVSHRMQSHVCWHLVDKIAAEVTAAPSSSAEKEVPHE